MTLAITIPPSRLATIIAAVPPSILLGLSVRDQRLRDRSRYALAEQIADGLEAAEPVDPNQLVFEL